MTDPTLASDESIPTIPAAEAILGELPSLQQELEELKDRHVRLAAEFDNYRKRVMRERAELEDRAQAKFVARLLDALDDLDRVAASDPATTTLEAVRGGVDAVHKKLVKELAAAGVERIDPAGVAFDPALHEAVSIIPAPDAAQERVVSATFQSGYVMKGQLVRPARVQVFSTEGSL
jgi:molecular chaperone GrpE